MLYDFQYGNGNDTLVMKNESHNLTENETNHDNATSIKALYESKTLNLSSLEILVFFLAIVLLAEDFGKV
jgi:hypothetical protein